MGAVGREIVTEQLERNRLLTGRLSSAVPTLTSQLANGHPLGMFNNSERFQNYMTLQLPQHQDQLSPHVAQYLRLQALNRIQQLRTHFSNSSLPITRPHNGAEFVFPQPTSSSYESWIAACLGQRPVGAIVPHGSYLSNFGRPNDSLGTGGRFYSGLSPLIRQTGTVGMHIEERAPVNPLGEIPHHLPAILARPSDSLKLSSHQVMLRHQIEAFHATEDDVSTHTRGRNKPITHGQVGIRCRHCAHLPVSRRQKGSTYFPASMLGIYQAAQNMSTTHMQCGLCREMPDCIKAQFAHLISTKVASSGAGRPYWAESAKQLGMVDTEDGIFIIRSLPSGVRLVGNNGDPEKARKPSSGPKRTGHEEQLSRI